MTSSPAATAFASPNMQSQHQGLLYFSNAHLIDPESETDCMGGLLVEDGIIVDFGAHLLNKVPKGAKVIDCKGHVLAPGLIDMQVYTGEPGMEHRETLASASRAAAAGGVTTMIVMPNTEPVIDAVALVDFIERRARDTAIVNVHPMAAMTRQLAGENMTELGLLQEAGALAFTNGKQSIANSKIMRGILSYAKDFNALIVHSIEDAQLAGSGVMNEGLVSSRLGLPGIPKEAEIIMLERDIQLVHLTKGRYHSAQISCGESLEVIKKAKKNGLPVTCGVSINHLCLNENDIGSYKTFIKMKPPLRTEDDRLTLVEGLKNGDIDIIVSAHDPKDADLKRRPFEEASYGAVGLETMLAAALRLYHSQQIDLLTLLKPLTINPANLLGLPSGRLKVGSPADLILIDTEIPWMVNLDILSTRSRNTPFEGARLQGRVTETFIAGQSVFKM